MANRRSPLAIEIETVSDQLTMREAQLDLIDDQRLPNVPLQKLDLSGRVVAHTEVAHLPCAMQLIERLRDLFRLHERIRAMKQQDVQPVGAQALQAAFD